MKLDNLRTPGLHSPNAISEHITLFETMRALLKRAASCFPQKKSLSPTRRKVSISCRGKPISQAELFGYTNGHFLVDEEQQYSKRWIKFDVQKLCAMVSSLTDKAAPVCKIEKMEGGFSKALLITTKAGDEVIAKISCPNAGRSMYSTASEAATLEYVRSRTTLPVPKVLAWDSTTTNPVGAEYIIMEKAPGVQLFKVWDDIPEVGRLKIIKSLTQLEHQLASIKFPAYGSLYFRESISKLSERIDLGSSEDPEELFCVGPGCGPAWTKGITPVDVQTGLDVGPWPTLEQLGTALAQRSIARARLHVNPGVASTFHGTVEEHVSILEMAKKLSPNLGSYQPLLDRSQPTLWHTDLHMGNIFVSEQDHTQIVSFIDWQSTSISPLFQQVRWPVFLEPGEGYTYHGTLELPKLPANFEELDPDDKEMAIHQKDQAVCTKAYEVATYINNRGAYEAKWKTAEPLHEFFRRIGDTWDDSIIPLRSCLIEIHQKWDQLGFSEACPIHFTNTDISTHEAKLSAYMQWHEIRAFCKNYLVTDDDGWVPPEADFAEKQTRNRALLGLTIEQRAGQMSEHEVRQAWPFPV